MKEILIIALSNIDSDPRVLRQISLFENSSNVTVVGFSEYKNEGVNFIQLSRPIRKKGLGRLRSQIKTVFLLLTMNHKLYYWLALNNRLHLDKLDLQKKYDVVIANDFDSAPIALALDSDKYILDAHEYTPDENYLSLAKLIFSGYKHWLCRSFIHNFDKIFTVSDGIARQYAFKYKVEKPALLLNTPRFENLLPSNPVGLSYRIVHHGIAVRGRGIEDIISLMALLPSNFSLYFYLVPLDRGFYNSLIERANSNPRIHFESPVPTSEIAKTINRYDIGIFLAPHLSLNHTNTLPNKFFEFIQARLMIAITPSLEMESIIKRFDLGIIFDSFDIETIAKQLMMLSPSDVMLHKQKSHLAAAELNWEKQNLAFKNYVLGF